VLKKLKWYYNRLKLMSVREIVGYRFPQFLQYRFLGKKQLHKNYKPLSYKSDFQCSNYDKKTLDTLFKIAAFKKDYPVFDLNVDISKVTNWRKDPASGKISPLQYYGKIKRQDFKTNGDVKYLSELSRMEFLPFWAFQYVCTSDEYYRKKITEIITVWNVQNPYLKSIHWTSGIEVAIRSVNLIYTLIILTRFEKPSEKIKTEICWQITRNYEFLKKHLSKFSSANNHRMAELMGLNVIASCFSVKEKEVKKWQNLFFTEVKNQINPDGVHNELCSQYHAEVLDQILITQEFLKARDVEIPNQVSELNKKMFEFNQQIVSAKSETIFGDNDEGSVLNPYFDTEFNLFQSQLASANYLFKTKYQSTGKTDFRNYLIFGKALKIEENKPLLKDQVFEGSGYGFFYDPENGAKLSFDVGKMGDSISAAHAHSDIFHFNFSKNGVPFFVDPGTFQYHSKNLFWRNYFRSISAHSTISINQNQHAKMNGRMSWWKMPDVKIESVEINENRSICKAVSDAFKNDGVTHRRQFIVDKKRKKVSIEDVLISENNTKHQLDFYLQLHLKVKIIKEGKTWKLKNENETVLLQNELFDQAQLISGNSNQPLGWFSPQFGQKTIGQTLHLKLEFQKEFNLLTTISYASE